MNRFFALLQALLIMLLVLPFSGLAGQPSVASPVENSGFTRITSYDSLQAFVQRLRTVPGMAVDRIGTTVQGRDISVVGISSSPTFGEDASKLRILLFAQQHATRRRERKR
jgi:murein tripeptide amidase MpaA